MSQRNEFNAIRLSLMKAISSTPYQKGSRCENVKTISIDVPCAPNVFMENFVSKCALINYDGQDNFKCTVSASDLQNVFGTN